MNRRTVWGWALFASIGINLLFVGAYVGGKFRHHPRRMAPADGQRKVAGQAKAPARSQLSPHRVKLQQDNSARNKEARRRGPPTLSLLRSVVKTMGGRKDPRVAELLQNKRQHFAQQRGKVKQAHDRAIAALTAQPYIEEDLAQALAELAELSREGQSRADSSLLSLAAKLTKAERQQLSEIFSNRDRGGRMR